MFLKNPKTFPFLLDFGLAFMLVLAILLAACQTTSKQTATLPELTQNPRTTGVIPVTGAATVMAGSSSSLGKILVDSQGMTLYTNKDDSPGTSNCSGECLIGWAPMAISGMPTAGDGVSGKLGVITRDDGTLQLTYNDLPLYYYTNDAQPGDVSGQGVDSVWSVVKL